MFLLIHLLLGIQPEKSNLHNRSNKISKLSVIEHGATLGKNNIICENVIIRSNVTIGNNNWVGPNSILENNVTIGDNNKFYGFLSAGSLGEMGSKGDSLSKEACVKIGNFNIFREFVTINSPVKRKKTIILNNCYFMARTHIPHDAFIGNNVIMANNSGLGGGCTISDYVYVGLNAHVHQWLSIGEGAMLGINSATINNIPPFCTAVGVPSKIIKINFEGLKRRNFKDKDINFLNDYVLSKDRSSINKKNSLIDKYNEFLDSHENYIEIKSI